MVAARIVLLVAGSYEWLTRATRADLSVCSELYKLYAGQAYLALSFPLDLPLLSYLSGYP
jgi:hypothetical protein